MATWTDLSLGTWELRLSQALRMTSCKKPSHPKKMVYKDLFNSFRDNTGVAGGKVCVEDVLDKDTPQNRIVLSVSYHSNAVLLTNFVLNGRIRKLTRC